MRRLSEKLVSTLQIKGRLGMVGAYVLGGWFVDIGGFGQSLLLSTPGSFLGPPFYRPGDFG
jgi:hypothetical protein